MITFMILQQREVHRPIFLSDNRSLLLVNWWSSIFWKDRVQEYTHISILPVFILLQSSWVRDLLMIYLYYLVFFDDLKQEVPCLCPHHTAHTYNPISKKCRTLWPVMMDDTATTHKRKKLIKTYKKSRPSKTDCGCWGIQCDLFKKNDQNKME